MRQSKLLTGLERLISLRGKLLLTIIALAAASGLEGNVQGQSGDEGHKTPRSARSSGTPNESKKRPRRTATIHWQRVPLRDAMKRLRDLFDEAIFIDRRIDPGKRISLDIDGATVEEIVAALAAENRWSTTRIESLVYLGPAGASDELQTLIMARSQEVARLAAEIRKQFLEKQTTEWQRLAQPQSVIAAAVEQRGWRLAHGEAIPHDLWPAGELPALTLAEQLTVLLIGFDLTFELRPQNQAIEIIAIPAAIRHRAAQAAAGQPASAQKPPKSNQAAKQVYTLRVREQPVGAVLKQFSQRLHWSIRIDEEAIRKAGKSLDKRVSFSVEDADREQLLEALLAPAGLGYQLDGDQVRIVPGRY